MTNSAKEDMKVCTHDGSVENLDGLKICLRCQLADPMLSQALAKAADEVLAKLARQRADAWALSVEGTLYGVTEPVRRLEGK